MLAGQCILLLRNILTPAVAIHYYGCAILIYTMFTNFDITPCFLFTVLLASNMMQLSKTQACQPSPCQYGGTCFNSNLCQCPPGFTGPICTNVDCDNYPCLNGGTCSRGLIQNQDTCQCLDGFVLPFCTTSCLIVPCQNGGTCSDDVCSCQSGFAGPTCQSAIAVYLSPLEVSVTEANTGNSNVRIHLCRQQSNLPASVTVVTSQVSAITSSDFFGVTTPVAIPIGQVCAPVDISIVSDMTFEPTEILHLVILSIQLPQSVHIVPGQGTATVTIIDNDDTQLPVISNCPGDISVSIAPETSYTSVAWATPTTSVNPGVVTLMSSHQPGDTFSLGQTTVIYTATDGAGNTQQCQFFITVMIDVNECSFSNLCDSSSSTCSNTIGSYICMCKSGYTGSPFTPGQPSACTDQDECTTSNLCDNSSSTCSNTIGSYICTCKSGYTGSPFTHGQPFTCTDSPPTTKPVTTTQVTTASTPSTPVATTEVTTASTPSTPVTTTEVITSSKPSTPMTTTQGRTSSTPSISTIPFTPPPGPVPVSGPCAEYLDYRNTNSETVFELVLSADLELVTETIINSNQCPDLLPAMCSLFYPPLPSSGYTLCQETCSQLFEDCQIAFAFLAGAMPESCSKLPPRNEPGDMMCIGASEPSSSPVYLVALVIPVLLIIILLVVIIKRIRRKPESEPKPGDVQDVDHVNTGVTDDPEVYIALEEQSRNTPAPKYQDLTKKEAPTQVSGYERTIHETADAAPKAMPRQGIKRQTDYQYEDVNLGETDARKLPSVPQPDLQSEDDAEYEDPDMFEEYTGVHINTLGASKPITPTPMKITEYKTFMGRERSKVISEIVQQYTALQTGQQHPWTAAVKLQNKPKNFFKALLPYDHSRVRLDTDGSDVRSDYINASYIKNHQGKVSFIAAQAPREGTKDDFWRMVWKEDVETIVTLVDKDGTEQHSKDAQYWPKKVNRSQKYGTITVLLMETIAFRSYVLREMNVIKGNEKVLTSVRQYEIQCWKYGGVPSKPADLISVIKQIKNHQNGGKHLLVHCSNGVGATGVFIGLYDLMDVIKTKKEVSVFDVIEGMRKDRVNMVLTKLQYLFIFDALLEAMLSPDSQMSCDQLKKLDLSAMKEKCKKEFQILQDTAKHQEDLATLAGNSSENNHKNRFPDLLPVDKFRPALKSPSNLFGSTDYINATFAKDISQRGFILTQSPLASTVEDFWRLVFDYDCNCILMLNTIDESDESLTVYWPNGHNAAASNGLMTVICKKIEESDVFTRRQFEVKHKRSQKSLLVDHFSFHGCPGSKPDVHKLREFIKYSRTKGTGPALVHCINGVGLSAVYVTVISELERIEKEDAVDVFQTLNKLRKQCPKAVQTQDEYLLCYELLRDHFNNPEEYAVVF